jgi:predicted transcriptional regulator of viral defense system
MRSVHRQILGIIHSFEQGKIFFPEQFDHIGSNESIRQALSRICKQGIIVRLSQGVYLYPEVDDESGLLYPSADTIAEAKTHRYRVRTTPIGAYALNK